jgi:acetone carboxylase gamma subunit
MASDADTFGRFVELVASNVDEHPARGVQLAARLYVSRSQRDRVVTAASGEAPGRFRRRILLERAACRLIAGSKCRVALCPRAFVVAVHDHLTVLCACDHRWRSCCPAALRTLM